MSLQNPWGRESLSTLPRSKKDIIIPTPPHAPLISKANWKKKFAQMWLKKKKAVTRFPNVKSMYIYYPRSRDSTAETHLKEINFQKCTTGVPCWLSGLKIGCCRCCVSALIPGPELPRAMGVANKTPK